MSTLPKCSLAESLASLPESVRQEALQGLSQSQASELLYDWRGFWARPNQLPPSSDWIYWIVLAGRGFGKTRIGAETVRQWAKDPNARILMIAPIASEVQGVMIDGPSGLMSCYPPDRRPVYNSSRNTVVFPSGAVAITRSAEEPERLRGPQFTKFWADEICAWNYMEEAWDQIMFGFRMLTAQLQGVITTTPKPTKLLKRIISNPRAVVTRGSSYDNRLNLSEEYFRTVIAPYEGTRLGRQEINAEILEDTPGALWTQALIDATRWERQRVNVDDIIRVVIAVDPAVSNTATSDEHGIIVAALNRAGHVAVLDDLTMKGSPLDWGRVVVAAFRSHNADRVVGEVNNGGDLVAANVHGLDPNIPFRAVRASRGKYRRAEPVAALYEQGRIHHVGFFPKLEEQMCGYVPNIEQDSPDHMDALVWAVTELLLDEEKIPQIRPMAFPVRISRY